LKKVVAIDIGVAVRVALNVCCAYAKTRTPVRQVSAVDHAVFIEVGCEGRSCGTHRQHAGRIQRGRVPHERSPNVGSTTDSNPAPLSVPPSRTSNDWLPCGRYPSVSETSRMPPLPGLTKGSDNSPVTMSLLKGVGDAGWPTLRHRLFSKIDKFAWFLRDYYVEMGLGPQAPRPIVASSCFRYSEARGMSVARLRDESDEFRIEVHGRNGDRSTGLDA
jgi:hypothetical protein